MEQLQAKIAALDERQKKDLLEKLKSRYAEYYEINPLSKGLLDKGIALSRGQNRILNMTLDFPERPVHVVSQLLTFKGKVNLDFLKQSIKAVVANHEAFSISFFKNEEGTWQQKVSEESRCLIQEVQLESGLDTVEHIKEFILSKKWLLPESSNIDFLIFDEKDAGIKLAVITHNLFFDAWSYEVLVEELLDAYKTLEGGKALDLHKKEHDFLSFVNWQNKWLNTKGAKEQLAYWQSKLQGFEYAKPHPDMKKDAAHSYSGKRIVFNLKASEKLAVEKISKQWSVSPFMILVSIIQAYLQKETNENSVSLGTINANRTRKHTDQIIGYLLNYIPLIIVFPADYTLESIVKKNKNNILEAFENTDIPFEYLVEKLGLDFNASQSPLFDLLFIYENIPQDNATYDAFQLENEEVDRSISRFNRTISIFDKKAHYECVLEYNDELFEEKTAADFVKNFQSFVEEKLKVYQA